MISSLTIGICFADSVVQAPYHHFMKKNIPFLLFSKVLRYIEDTADEKVLFPKKKLGIFGGIILVYLH